MHLVLVSLVRPFKCQVVSLAPAAILGLSIQIYPPPATEDFGCPQLSASPTGDTKETTTHGVPRSGD